MTAAAGPAELERGRELHTRMRVDVAPLLRVDLYKRMMAQSGVCMPSMFSGTRSGAEYWNYSHRAKRHRVRSVP